MTDPLRQLFDDMILDEPPLRTTADNAVAGGRRLRRRNRTLWTATGTALTVAAVALLPQVWPSPGSGLTVGASATADPSQSATGEASPDPTQPPSTELALTSYEVCPSPASTLSQPDGSVLPELATAQAAVVAQGPQIAPGMTFLPHAASALVVGGPKFGGDPVLTIIFDIGDDLTGYGSLNVQIRPETDATPQVRAARGASTTSCVEGWRYDFADGSVAIHYPYGTPMNEKDVTHVWYYAAGGFTMNIGMFPQGWDVVADAAPAPPSALPARGAMPLSIAQVMQVADVIAHSG